MRTQLVIALLSVVANLSAQNIMIFQPSGGLNDGSDEGSLSGGKETWVNRHAPTENYGSLDYWLTSARSNCNTSDYKGYFKFDVSGLPDNVNSVHFGVTHIEHTANCYSNCSADFYFYLCTSPWDEMTLIQENLPSEDTNSFFGPITIDFPNNFGLKEYDITSAYNYWKTNPQLNHGFVVYSPTVGCNNAGVFIGVQTSDDEIEENRPYLKVDYSDQTGIRQYLANFDVSPNPFNDFININLDNISYYSITNIKGQKVKAEYSSTNHQISTSHLSKGIYFLHFEINKEVKVVKLIKQ